MTLHFLDALRFYRRQIFPRFNPFWETFSSEIGGSHWVHLALVHSVLFTCLCCIFCTVVTIVYICSAIVYFCPLSVFLILMDSNGSPLPVFNPGWRGSEVYHKTPVACYGPCRNSSSDIWCRLSVSPLDARSLDSPHRMKSYLVNRAR